MSGRKIQVVLDETSLRAAQIGSTIASTVRDALGFYDWCRRAIDDGWTICAVRGETRREPLLRFEARR